MKHPEVNPVSPVEPEKGRGPLCHQGAPQMEISVLDRSQLPAATSGAGEEVRTLDPELGKLMLYQLSYARIRVRL